MQQWVLKGKGVKYWIVDSGVTMLPATVVPEDHEMSWEDRIVWAERDRLLRQDDNMVKVTDRNMIDDTTPWLLRTKWPQTFVNKDLRLIGRTRYSDLDTQTRLMFPEWSVIRTRLIASEFDKILRRARVTLSQTSHSLRMWLRSVKRNDPDQRPFNELQRHGSAHRYALESKQFLYLCFRIFQLDPTVREERYGIAFTAEQLQCMREVDMMMDAVLAERGYEEWEMNM